MTKRNSSELKNSYPTYKAYFEVKYPTEYSLTLNYVQNSMQTNIQKYTKNYQNLIDKLITLLHTNLQHIIRNQLFNLLKQPNSSNSLSSMIFSEDQYKVFNILINNWGQREYSKHPYFFLTGSAGTGKSFMIQQIVNFLINRNIKYLLMAPTGVAAKNVDGQTTLQKL
ncbi:hypothetical protein RhiirC2_781793 [Rhizophagus irregularis]|uniref:ATP-dependent DNA helicase n=1 Tax=Rhizophagus irregularis TaxID=588596 RepID=A0A2N1N4J0_9GLOM|nr:hypothetical protein RhiirC2_781793 [Rhizophagus irregularis]